jgi:8-oxo-dGTP pyrophosphatase MutT (NUDIX family)
VFAYHPAVQEAAGYIVYVSGEKGLQFLLLRNAKHHSWGFPKGKLEAGESARDGARRELEEETGIAEIHPDERFSAETTYELPRAGRGGDSEGEPTTKRVRYFLGRVDDRKFKRSSEHDAADWMSAEEVLATLKHEDLRRIFREANAHLRQSGARTA